MQLSWKQCQKHVLRWQAYVSLIAVYNLKIHRGWTLNCICESVLEAQVSLMNQHYQVYVAPEKYTVCEAYFRLRHHQM
jgi:hypothetical protein